MMSQRLMSWGLFDNGSIDPRNGIKNLFVRFLSNLTFDHVGNTKNIGMELR